MTLRHYAFSRQQRTQFSEDVYAFVLWRYVAVQIWRVKELFAPGIVASTILKVVSHRNLMISPWNSKWWYYSVGINSKMAPKALF